MNLSRKLPLLTSTLVVALCLILAATAVMGVNRMMTRTGQTVDEGLTAQLADQMTQGALREREQVLRLIDTAQRQLVATASSASALPVLRADRDDQLREQAIRPIAAGTLEIGRSVQAQVDQLGQALDQSVATMLALITDGKDWSNAGEPVDWETVDQAGRPATVQLPPLAIGGVPILTNDDPAVAVPQVDEPARLAGALVTIFQRAADDRMVRIATTVNQNGKRAIRTAIAPTGKDGRPNPVLTEVLAGRSYRGLAWVVDRWCVTAYQPLVAEGKVIGMLFAGKPILELPGLTDSIGRQRYGATGYAVLVDATGKLVTHPKVDLVGKHVVDDLHLDGLKPMLAAPADGTVGTCTYTFEGRDVFGCFFKMPNWKWTVLATGYIDEIAAELLAQSKARMSSELELLYHTAQVSTADGAQALFGQIRLLDATGLERLLIREGKQVVSTRSVEASWFTTALADTTTTGLLHRLEISVNTKKPELRITVPIRHGTMVAGVLAANLDWSVVQRAIGGHRYGKTGYPWIVNQDGVAVTHPKYSLGDHKNLTTSDMGELGERVRQVLATGEPWHGFYTFEGVRKFSAMLPLAIGSERGVIATAGPADELLEAASAMKTEMQMGRRQMTWLLVAVSLLVAAGGIIGAIWYVRRLLAPILRTEQVLGVLAQGDLTGRLTVTSNDEFGRMAQALDRGLGALGGTLGEISRNTQSIAGAAEELTAVSKQMSGNATAASNQTGQAAAATTEVATSIQTCAAGIEEMTASVDEIAKNAGQAASVAQDGVAATREADAAMTRLGTSSTEIGDIVKLIAGISEQTNLLALNATIEAARAGEHGRGFAVVAGEVKALARQTSEATADIGKRVASIQGDAASAQEVLRRIGEIVGRIHALQTSIAAAVEEQSATTKEIGGNLSQVAKAGSDISQNIAAVADAAKESSAGAGETLKAATELAKLAAELRQAVGRFKT